jgi:hypothetical protein
MRLSQEEYVYRRLYGTKPKVLVWCLLPLFTSIVVSVFTYGEVHSGAHFISHCDQKFYSDTLTAFIYLCLYIPTTLLWYVVFIKVGDRRKITFFSQSVSQSVSQSINQSINQSITILRSHICAP